MYDAWSLSASQKFWKESCDIHSTTFQKQELQTVLHDYFQSFWMAEMSHVMIVMESINLTLIVIVYSWRFFLKWTEQNMFLNL